MAELHQDEFNGFSSLLPSKKSETNQFQQQPQCFGQEANQVSQSQQDEQQLQYLDKINDGPAKNAIGQNSPNMIFSSPMPKEVQQLNDSNEDDAGTVSMEMFWKKGGTLAERALLNSGGGSARKGDQLTPKIAGEGLAANIHLQTGVFGPEDSPPQTTKYVRKPAAQREVVDLAARKKMLAAGGAAQVTQQQKIDQVPADKVELVDDQKNKEDIIKATQIKQENVLNLQKQIGFIQPPALLTKLTQGSICKYCDSNLSTNQSNNGNFSTEKQIVQQQKSSIQEDFQISCQQRLSKKYSDSSTYNNSKVLNNLIYNDDVHIVSIFKDYLILDDINEFLKRTYTMNETRSRLPKLCSFYDQYSQVFPNFVLLPESKYMFKNIQRKQKYIDDEYKFREKHVQKHHISLAEKDRYFNSKFQNSVYDFGAQPPSVNQSLSMTHRQYEEQAKIISQQAAPQAVKERESFQENPLSKLAHYRQFHLMKIDDLVEHYIDKDSHSTLQIEDSGISMGINFTESLIAPQPLENSPKHQSNIVNIAIFNTNNSQTTKQELQETGFGTGFGTVTGTVLCTAQQSTKNKLSSTRSIGKQVFQFNDFPSATSTNEFQNTNTRVQNRNAGNVVFVNSQQNTTKYNNINAGFSTNTKKTNSSSKMSGTKTTKTKNKSKFVQPKLNTPSASGGGGYQKQKDEIVSNYQYDVQSINSNSNSDTTPRVNKQQLQRSEMSRSNERASELQNQIQQQQKQSPSTKDSVRNYLQMVQIDLAAAAEVDVESQRTLSSRRANPNQQNQIISIATTPQSAINKVIMINSNSCKSIGINSIEGNSGTVNTRASKQLKPNHPKQQQKTLAKVGSVKSNLTKSPGSAKKRAFLTIKNPNHFDQQNTAYANIASRDSQNLNTNPQMIAMRKNSNRQTMKSQQAIDRLGQVQLNTNQQRDIQTKSSSRLSVGKPHHTLKHSQSDLKVGISQGQQIPHKTMDLNSQLLLKDQPIPNCKDLINELNSRNNNQYNINSSQSQVKTSVSNNAKYLTGDLNGRYQESEINQMKNIPLGDTHKLVVTKVDIHNGTFGSQENCQQLNQFNNGNLIDHNQHQQIPPRGVEASLFYRKEGQFLNKDENDNQVFSNNNNFEQIKQHLEQYIAYTQSYPNDAQSETINSQSQQAQYLSLGCHSNLPIQDYEKTEIDIQQFGKNSLIDRGRATTSEMLQIPSSNFSTSSRNGIHLLVNSASNTEEYSSQNFHQSEKSLIKTAQSKTQSIANHGQPSTQLNANKPTIINKKKKIVQKGSSSQQSNNLANSRSQKFFTSPVDLKESPQQKFHQGGVRKAPPQSNEMQREEFQRKTLAETGAYQSTTQTMRQDNHISTMPAPSSTFRKSNLSYNTSHQNNTQNSQAINDKDRLVIRSKSKNQQQINGTNLRSSQNFTGGHSLLLNSESQQKYNQEHQNHKKQQMSQVNANSKRSMTSSQAFSINEIQLNSDQNMNDKQAIYGFDNNIQDTEDGDGANYLSNNLAQTMKSSYSHKALSKIVSSPNQYQHKSPATKQVTLIGTSSRQGQQASRHARNNKQAFLSANTKPVNMASSLVDQGLSTNSNHDSASLITQNSAHKNKQINSLASSQSQKQLQYLTSSQPLQTYQVQGININNKIIAKKSKKLSSHMIQPNQVVKNQKSVAGGLQQSRSESNFQHLTPISTSLNKLYVQQKLNSQPTTQQYQEISSKNQHELHGTEFNSEVKNFIACQEEYSPAGKSKFLNK